MLKRETLMFDIQIGSINLFGLFVFFSCPYAVYHL